MNNVSSATGATTLKQRHPLHQRPLIRLLSVMVVLICAGWFTYALVRQGPDILTLLKNPALALLLPLLVIVLQAGMILTGLGFHILIRAMGQDCRLSDAIWILMLSQFGKYLPGNFAHHLGRIGLARMRGCAVGSALIAVVIEMAASLLVAAVTGASVILTAPVKLRDSLAPWLPASDITGPAVLALVVVLFIAGFAALRLWRSRLKQAFPGLRAIGAAVLISIVNIAVLGFVMWLVLRALAPDTPLPFLFVAGVYACAWIIGTVTPGAPGGLGVREAILVVLLAPYCGEGVAIAAALYLRVATTFADLLSFLIGLVWRRVALRAPVPVADEQGIFR